MVGYATRQQTYTTGDVIEALDTNDEFNAILSALDAATGHTHGGSAGEGAPVVATTLTGGTQYGVLLLNGTGVASTSTAAFTGGQLLIGQAAAVPGPKTISGDATLGASGALTLASTAVTPASYGSATASPTYTVDAKGRLTAAADVTITPAFSSITSTPTTLAGYGITDAQGLDATLTSLAALGTAADKFAYTTGVDTWAEAAITAAGLAILDDANAAAQRTTLGLVIGTNVQAWDTQLDDIAALAVTDGNFIVGDGANWVVESGATALTSIGGIGAATTDTLTNKTFDANGTGNSLSNVDVADLANGTDGELITWDSAGAPATVGVGTVTHVLTSNGLGAAPTFQAPSGGGVLSASFTSTNQTITAAGPLTLAHSLGAMPTLVIVWLECTTTDNGYAVGDKIVANGSMATASTNGFGMALWADTTNIYIRFGAQAATFLQPGKATGALNSLVNSSWELYVEAVA